MSTFTVNKNIEQPAHGSYANAWDVPANADFAIIDNALAGTSSVVVTGASGTVALTVGQYTPPNIEFTGALTNNVTYALPTGVGWVGTLYNNTSGAYTLQFGVSGGGTIALAQGVRTAVVVDSSGNVALFDTNTLAAAEAFAIGAANTAQSNAEAFATAADVVVTTNTEAFATAAANAAQTNAENFTSASYAPLASPPLTGVPTAPTAAGTTNTTQLATTAFVQGLLGTFTHSGAAGGTFYAKLPGGLVIQGASASANTTATITFGTPFTTACFSVVAQTIGVLNQFTGVTGLTATNFELYCAGGYAVLYVAYGY